MSRNDKAWYRLAILVAVIFAALTVYDLYSSHPWAAVRDFALGFLSIGLAVRVRHTA
jgi:hypothetical protein